MADHEDDSAVEALNPSKRIKTADGSAVASAGSTPAREPEIDDDEMHDANGNSEHAPPARKGIMIRRKSRSSTRADEEAEAAQRAAEDAEEAEAAIDDDVGDVTVMHTNGNSLSDKKLPTRAGSSSVNNSSSHAGQDHATDAMSDISEDTDGDVPMPKRHSPTSTYHYLSEDDINNNEPQVTICAWDGCDTGDLGTMDKLVEHLHAEHVEGKQRRYTCEWVGCPRKGKSHASAYALKAHLRSHTREKPHVCLLPGKFRSTPLWMMSVRD